MINELYQCKEFAEIIFTWKSFEEEFQYNIWDQSLEVNHKTTLTSNHLSSMQETIMWKVSNKV